MSSVFSAFSVFSVFSVFSAFSVDPAVSLRSHQTISHSCAAASSVLRLERDVSGDNLACPILCVFISQAVYAVGDCCTKYQFTHAADFMARIVIRNALFFGKCSFCAPLVVDVGAAVSRRCFCSIRCWFFAFASRQNFRSRWLVELGFRFVRFSRFFFPPCILTRTYPAG